MKILILAVLLLLTSCSAEYKKCSGKVKTTYGGELVFTNADVIMAEFAIKIKKKDNSIKEDYYIPIEKIGSIKLNFKE